MFFPDTDAMAGKSFVVFVLCVGYVRKFVVVFITVFVDAAVVTVVILIGIYPFFHYFSSTVVRLPNITEL